MVSHPLSVSCVQASLRTRFWMRANCPQGSTTGASTIPGNPAETAGSAGLGQARAVSDETRPMPAEGMPMPDPGAGPRTAVDGLGQGPGPDPLTAIAIQTLSQAVEMLRDDVERERNRADRAEREVEEGRKRIDERHVLMASTPTSPTPAPPR